MDFEWRVGPALQTTCPLSLAVLVTSIATDSPAAEQTLHTQPKQLTVQGSKLRQL